MSDCFAFRFFEPHEDKRKSLVLFFSSDISADSIIKTLKTDVEENLIPHNVYILGVKGSSGVLSNIKSDSSFTSEFDSFVGDMGSKLKCALVNSDGGISDTSSGDEVPSALGKVLIHAGMITLFKKRKGLITSSLSYHFVKPSGDHCDKFIRASNLLISSVEVSFLAIALLPYLKEGIRRIYVDTSSISYLVSTAVSLSEKFSNKPPLVESFESYSVFNQKYDFVESIDSLVVISATTSGSLAKSLERDTAFNYSQIVTLFHLGLPDEQNGIFDITMAVPDKIVSRKAMDCGFCKRGSKLIRIAGDQFLPETPRHELLVIKKTDFDKHREQFFKEFSTRKILNWNIVSDCRADSKEHFFIDVKKIVVDAPEKFSEDLDRAIKRYVSRDVKTIVRLNDDGSNELSKKILEKLGENHGISCQNLVDIDETCLQSFTSVIVVAGAITSGRNLLAASRKLRGIDKSASIIYLVGFSKLPTTESLDQLKKDLCQGGHEFFVLRKCPLPRIKEYTKTAWDWELEELNKWNNSDPLSDEDQNLPKSLIARAKILSSDAGDPDQLFLSQHDGGKLSLRRAFAFWSDLDLDSDKATQADVYWTIQSVLHDLRMRSDEKGLASIYHTTLISPVCFDRYNDGVIQASLLRAAKPIELNYAVDEEFSRKMTDVVLSVLSNWNNAQGEAAMEFLLAIWTERLQFIETHIKELMELKNEEMPQEMQFIFDKIYKNHNCQEKI